MMSKIGVSIFYLYIYNIYIYIIYITSKPTLSAYPLGFSNCYRYRYQLQKQNSGIPPI